MSDHTTSTQDRIEELAIRLYALATDRPVQDLGPADVPAMARMSEALKSELWRIEALASATGMSQADVAAANTAIDAGEPGMKFVDEPPGHPSDQIDYGSAFQQIRANPGRWAELADFKWFAHPDVLADLLWKGTRRTLASDEFRTALRGSAVYVTYVGGGS